MKVIPAEKTDICDEHIDYTPKTVRAKWVVIVGKHEVHLCSECLFTLHRITKE